MKKIVWLMYFILLWNCKSKAQEQEKTTFKITKTDAEWKAQLSESAYNVLRKSGTERPFSSPYNANKADGIYACAGCNTPLFKSDNKFDSGTGWPSFDREIKGNVAFSTDYKIGYGRTEEHCATCGGHLGHVFNDGPTKTGQRHCINGAALTFTPKNNE